MTLLLFDSLSPGCKKALVWIASAWLFYTGFGFLILPLLVRAVAVKELSKQLDRSVTIQKVRLNPYTLSATIRAVLVKDKDGAPLVSWNEAYLNFQLASLFKRAWIFKEITLSQPFVRVQMNRDYTLTFSDIVAKLTNSAALRPSRVGKRRALRIDRLRFIGARAAFTDLTPRVPFRRTIGPFAMTLTHFSTDSDNKNPYSFSGITDAGEQIAWQGFFYLDPLRSEGEFSLQGICLAKYAPLYQDAVRFEIKDGVIDLHSTYRYEKSATIHLLSVSNATFEAKSLRIVEKETGQPVVEVARCLVSGASMDAMARRAEADVVAITEGRLALHRNKDTSVNVIELAKPADAAPNTPGGIILLLRAMTNVVAMLLNTTNLSTGAVRDLNLTNCTLHLEDLVNTQPVRLDLQDISVKATNISNRAGSNMTAEIRMRWDTNGVVRADIRAGLSPPEAEVKLALDKLDLRPLAAYLEPYVGYQLKQGTFSLNSSVSLAERKLRSENQITLDQLIFGEKVESPEATKLPVRLALAILKDRNGKIELDVPVDGSLADPDFHLGEIVSSAIGNVLNKIATSPFSALSALFGGKGEALSFYEFEPGSTNLLPASTEKLDALANGLSARPELQLEIEGGVDAKTDLEALRREKLRNPYHLPTWQANDTTNATNVTRTTFNVVADEKGGAALMRMGTSDLLGPGDTSLGDLRTLAAERAGNIKAYILQTGKVEEERISVRRSSGNIPAKGSHVYLTLQSPTS